MATPRAAVGELQPGLESIQRVSVELAAVEADPVRIPWRRGGVGRARGGRGDRSIEADLDAERANHSELDLAADHVRPAPPGAVVTSGRSAASSATCCSSVEALFGSGMVTASSRSRLGRVEDRLEVRRVAGVMVDRLLDEERQVVGVLQPPWISGTTVR